MTDYDDFKKFSSAGAPASLNKSAQNVLTVGMRSDGNICILSDPNQPGPVQVSNFIMSKDTARWLAREILRLTETALPGIAKDGDRG